MGKSLACVSESCLHFYYFDLHMNFGICSGHICACRLSESEAYESVNRAKKVIKDFNFYLGHIFLQIHHQK